MKKENNKRKIFVIARIPNERIVDDFREPFEELDWVYVSAETIINLKPKDPNDLKVWCIDVSVVGSLDNMEKPTIEILREGLDRALQHPELPIFVVADNGPMDEILDYMTGEYPEFEIHAIGLPGPTQSVARFTYIKIFAPGYEKHPDKKYIYEVVQFMRYFRHIMLAAKKILEEDMLLPDSIEGKN